MRIVSWNVNGFRAVWKKDFCAWLEQTDPDICCLQETKADPAQLTGEQLSPLGRPTCFNSSQRKAGYSGTATISRIPTDSIQTGFCDGSGFDDEGRMLITSHFGGKLWVANVYFPNGQMGEERLAYKMAYYEHTLKYFAGWMAEGRKIIVCGDYNTAHHEIDLARPKENSNTSGFLPIEREWMDRWTKAGWIDSFRTLHPEAIEYSWWNMRTRARERNVGWRIDYHFITPNLLPALIGASITPEVPGSDHCPVWLELDESKL